MTPRYIIERWPHGWLICGRGASRIPMNALAEAQMMFPTGSLIFIGIAHHFRQTGHPSAVMAVAAPDDGEKWICEIEDGIRSLSPEKRWWCGTDVGRSSAAMFAAFCDTSLAVRVAAFAEGAVPGDADDFGRCVRMLTRFPEWRARLDRVSAAYPDTQWPAIIARWGELEAAEPAEQTAILRELSR